jgi:hypothetical protein
VLVFNVALSKHLLPYYSQYENDDGFLRAKKNHKKSHKLATNNIIKRKPRISVTFISSPTA